VYLGPQFPLKRDNRTTPVQTIANFPWSSQKMNSLEHLCSRGVFLKAKFHHISNFFWVDNGNTNLFLSFSSCQIPRICLSENHQICVRSSSRVAKNIEPCFFLIYKINFLFVPIFALVSYGWSPPNLQIRNVIEKRV
jgi:hypothetical protein